MDTPTLEALHIITRALHDMAPQDNAVRDLLWSLEADLRASRDDPAQLRVALDFRADHEDRVMAGVR